MSLETDRSSAEDLPTDSAPFALTGAQPKMALVLEDGVFRSSSTESLAQQQTLSTPTIAALVKWCRMLMENGETTEEHVALHAGLHLLRTRHWFTDAQNVWLMQKVAEHLQWTPLDIEAGTAKWVECDAVPYWMDPVGPNLPRPMSRVELLMRSAQGLSTSEWKPRR